ncbi:tellurite resistance TerB family protein [Rhodobacter sp. Har01]|uniref:DUF533 domain-containing protein n=1 Tax=Rhodobacter sp. Har01 TaxID=2883999 RepID=UPI001D06E6D7|nr:DUF533 domain-containing protein [Rhodobacter sp. Har01]MCB6177209.1 tellurite resistance TerB family protein [Rhodobacter sp. Har01]
MSLGKTLMRVLIGVAIAKGVSTLAKKGNAGIDTSGAGTGSRYDGGKGGLEDMMGDILGGKSRTTKTTKTSGGGQGSGEGGGLGDLLDQISGSKRSTPRKTAPKGGFDDLLGQLTGASSTKAPKAGSAGSGGVGDLLDQVLGGTKAAAGKPMMLPEPEQEQELSAALMLRAVIQAVKCDGDLDEAEKRKLMDAMGDADASEVKAVNAELARPVDVDGLARAVPAGMEPQVYTVSLMAIDLDQQAEAQYLHALAQALELTPAEVNALHDRAGAPRIYR